MASKNIDSIKVGLGVDLATLESDLASAKAKLDRDFPKGKEAERKLRLRIVAPSGTGAGSVEHYAKSVERRLKEMKLDVNPKLRINASTLRGMRDDINAFFAKENQRTGTQTNAIKVKVKPDVNQQQFRADVVKQVGYVAIPVYGDFKGWKGGQPPSSMGDQGGRGGRGGGGAGGAGAAGQPPPQQTTRQQRGPRQSAQQQQRAAQPSPEPQQPSPQPTAAAGSTPRQQPARQRTTTRQTTVEQDRQQQTQQRQQAAARQQREARAAQVAVPPPVVSQPPQAETEPATRTSGRQRDTTTLSTRTPEGRAAIRDILGIQGPRTTRREQTRGGRGRAYRMAGSVPTTVNPELRAEKEAELQAQRKALSEALQRGEITEEGFSRGKRAIEALNMATSDPVQAIGIIEEVLARGEVDPGKRGHNIEGTAEALVAATREYEVGNLDRAAELAQIAHGSLMGVDPKIGRALKRIGAGSRRSAKGYEGLTVLQSMMQAIPATVARRTEQSAAIRISSGKSGRGRTEPAVGVGEITPEWLEKLAGETPAVTAAQVAAKKPMTAKEMADAEAKEEREKQRRFVAPGETDVVQERKQKLRRSAAARAEVAAARGGPGEYDASKDAERQAKRSAWLKAMDKLAEAKRIQLPEITTAGPEADAERKANYEAKQKAIAEAQAEYDRLDAELTALAGSRKEGGGVYKDVWLQARAKGAEKIRSAPAPTAFDLERLKRLKAKYGGDMSLVEREMRGGTPQRRERKKKLVEEFGFGGGEAPCLTCGAPLNEATATAERIWPGREGGSYRFENLLPLCETCNKSRSKKALTAEDLEADPFAQRKQGGRTKANYRIAQRDVPGKYGFTRVFDAYKDEWSKDPLGSVQVHFDMDENPLDVFPEVRPGFQRRGIASALYEHIAKNTDIPIEAISDQNALEGHQFEAGAAFWQARKRKQGWTDKDIEEFYESGEPPFGMKQGGLIERLLSGTLDAKGAIRPGMEARSQQLNQLMEQKRAGRRKPYGPQMPGVYMVGEAGPEVFVPDQDGTIIPTHLMHMLPKRAAGGRTYTRPLAPEPRSGLGPPWRRSGREAFEGEREAIAKGQLSSAGGVQRVFVVNFEQLAAQMGRMGFQGQQQAQWPWQGQTRTRTRAQQQAQQFGQPQPGQPGPAPAPGQAGFWGQQQQFWAHTPAAPAPAGGGAGAPPGGPPQFGQPLGGPQGGTAGGTASGRFRATSTVGSALAAQQSVESLRERIGTSRIATSEALQYAPARALSVAVGQISQAAVGGRGGILERSRRAALEGEKATKLVTMQERQTQKVGDLLRARQEMRATLAPGPERQAEEAKATAAIKRQIAEAREAAGPAAEAVMRQEILAKGLKGAIKGALTDPNVSKHQAQANAKEIERIGATMTPEQQRGIITKPDIARSLGAGAIGITLGTMAFSTGMQVAQMAVQAFSVVAEDAADAISGFGLTARKVGNELAEGIRAAMGDVGVVSRRMAQLGIPVETQARLGGALTTVAQRQAGNLNLSDAIDLMRTGRNFSETLRRGGPVPGLTQTTGGFLGTPIGGTASTLELMTGVLQSETEIENEKLIANLGNIFAPGPAQRNQQGQLVPGFAAGLSAMDQIQQDAVTNAEDYWTAWNGYTERAGDTYGKVISNASDDAVKATMDAVQAAGGTYAQAARFTALGHALEGIEKLDPMKARAAILRYLEGLQIGAGMIEPTAMIQGMRRQVSAQIAAAEREAAYQRDVSIPVREAFAQLGRPLTTPTTGIMPGRLGVFGAGRPGPFPTGGPEAVDFPPRLLESGSRYADIIERVQATRRELAEEGGPLMEEMIPAEGQEALDLLRSLGAEAKELRSHLETTQLTFAYEQNARQQQLLVRSLGDAVGLAGQQTVSARVLTGFNEQQVAQYDQMVVQSTKLGHLQRQQLLNNRAMAREQLGLNQMNIDFQRALAQIQIPGETAAERAAFKANTEKRLSIEQRMQDYSEKGFQLDVQIGDETIARSLEDLTKQLQEFKASEAISIDAQQVTKALGEIDSAITALEGYAGTWINTQEQVAGIQRGMVAEVDAMTDQALDSFASAAEDRFTVIRDQILATWALVQSPGTVGEGQNLNPYGRDTTSGYYGRAGGGPVAAGTSYIVGERGPELFTPNISGAIIPNWNNTTMPSSGGGGSLTVNFNGPVNVRDEGDLYAIARKVEQVLNRKALAVGLAA